jgi:hypothetical protein
MDDPYYKIQGLTVVAFSIYLKTFLSFLEYLEGDGREGKSGQKTFG